MGKKKDAALHGTSKKDRAKLEARAAELAAEIERREKKIAKKAKGKKSKPEPEPKKKAGKKSGKVKKAKADRPALVDTGALGTMTIGPEAAIVPGPETPEEEAARHPHLAHLDRVGELAAIVADPDAKPKKKAKAEAELAALRAEGERLNAERDAKLAVDDAALKEKVAAKRAARAAAEKSDEPAGEKVVDIKAARMPDALEGESEVDYQHRKLREKKAASADVKVEAALADAVEAVKTAVDVVETETGRIFEAGESVATDAPEEFAMPSEAGPELEEGRNGYKIIMLNAEGNPDPRKVRQLTRVTTFVGNIDDETILRQWEKRLLAEGLSAHADEYAPRVNDIVHRREVAIAKARKADRKGKLGIGELGDLEAAAMKESKDALNALVEEALEAAGRNDKADAGTNLHALAEISDEKGIDAVREMHEAGEISATDLASIEAYAERMTRLGAKVIESEAVIVNDDLGYAGRLDRIIMAKLPALKLKTATGVIERPADQRARRYVTDIKSGRIDLGAGKISRQLAAYALGDLYNLETGERTRHSAARDIALVFHLPQGKGACSVHAVDIKTGATLLKLSAEVRRARNTGKKTIDTSVDITDPEPEGDDEKAGE